MDFFRVLAIKYHQHPHDAISYLKKYAEAVHETPSSENAYRENITSNTSTKVVAIDAIEEIRSFYPMNKVEKLKLAAKLFFNVIVISGWALYMWALGTNIGIMYRWFHCEEHMNTNSESGLNGKLVSCLTFISGK